MRITHKSRPAGTRSFGVALALLLVAFLLVGNAVLYGVANRQGWYFRAAETYRHTIGHTTDAYLSEVAGRGQVTILFCRGREELESDAVYRLVYQTALQFAERYAFVSVEHVNIFTDPDRVEPYKYEIDPETGDYRRDPKTGERVTVRQVNTSSVIFASDTESVVLGMSAFFVLDSNQLITAYNGEELTAAMIRRVLTGNHPTAYFTTNHGESYSEDLANRLICAGYGVRTIDLLREEPEAGGILIISNPRYDFAQGNPAGGIRAEIEKLADYLSAGNSVYVFLDPLVEETTRLEAFLAEWGLSRGAGLIRDADDSVTTDGYALITSFADNPEAEKIAAGMREVGAGRVILRSAAPLRLSGNANAILTASSSARVWENGEMTDHAGGYPVAAVSRGQSGGGIFLVSSVYLTATDAMTTNEYGNRDLIFYLLASLSGAAVPTGCTVLLIEPTTLENLTMREARGWTILVCVLLPAAIAVTGAVVIRKRRIR